MSSTSGCNLADVIPSGLGICRDCATHRSVVAFALDMVLSHCAHTQTGAYRVADGHWVVRNVSGQTFYGDLARKVASHEWRRNPAFMHGLEDDLRACLGDVAFDNGEGERPH